MRPGAPGDVSDRSLQRVRDGFGRDVNEPVRWLAGSSSEWPSQLAVTTDEMEWYLFEQGYRTFTWCAPASYGGWYGEVRKQGLTAVPDEASIREGPSAGPSS